MTKLLAFLVLIVAAFAISEQSHEQTVIVSGPDLQCADEGDREQMRKLLYEAIDNGFREHALHLYEVMIKDPHDQPGRAMRGLRPAIFAYVKSRRAIDDWDPPSCATTEKPK